MSAGNWLDLETLGLDRFYPKSSWHVYYVEVDIGIQILRHYEMGLLVTDGSAEFEIYPVQVQDSR